MSQEDTWMKELSETAHEAGKLFEQFVMTIGQLRHPTHGCPWDLEQDHQSLRRYMIEEAYEAAFAMLGDDQEEIVEELGDVLLQVVLNAQVSADQQKQDVRDVIRGIDSKMIRRHPHVFQANTGSATEIAEIKKKWAEIKVAEKKHKGLDVSGRVFEEAKKVSPALTQAFKIGKIAAQIDFDWESTEGVLRHFKSEIEELELGIRSQNESEIRSELGDVFFTLVQVCRHLGFEPETVAHEGNWKFLQRFEKVEDLASSKGKKVRELGAKELEELWVEVKRQTKK